MSWGYFGFKPYVPVAKKQANAKRKLDRILLEEKRGAAPIVRGRKVPATFWGKAWCENLEAYSDFENRLPRGRTYVCNGSVMDLQIDRGCIKAWVAGSELYKVEIKIKPLKKALWQAILAECAGKIDSLIELLQGRLSSGVMQIVTRREKGLFPTPKEIEMDCSCPDWAGMCKHVAAVLYGAGKRLDQNPALLFTLRCVDPAELISRASTAKAVRQTTRKAAGVPVMSDAELSEVFGIEVQTGSSSKIKAPASTLTPIAKKKHLPKSKLVVARTHKKPSA